MQTTREDSAVYYQAIDGMRALAVLSVVLFHLNPAWLPGGFVGVDIFFVISGFVVSASVSRLPSSTSLGAFLKYFYARRLTRIAPALIVCLLATSLLSTLLVPSAWLSETNDRTGFAAFFGFSNFVLAHSANDYFSPRTEFNPYTHTWSLAVEEQFYLIFPWLFIGWLKAGGTGRVARLVLASLALLSVASCLYCAWATPHAPAQAFYLIPARFWELGCGVLLFMSRSWWAPRLSALSGGSAAALGLMAVAALGASVVMADQTRFPWPWALLPTAGSTLLLAVVTGRSSGFLSGLLSTRPFVALGLLSYSLYLWHWPVFVLMRWTVGLDTLWLRGLALGLAVGLAMASYRWVEQPLRRSRRVHHMPRQHVVAWGLAVVMVASGLSVALFKSKPRLSLSQTSQGDVWYPYYLAQHGGPEPRCRVRNDVTPFAGGERTALVPENCAASSSSSSRPVRRLLVSGDSHAGVYVAMLRLFAEQTGHEVVVFTKGGCSLFNLRVVNASNAPECGQFAKATVQSLTSMARPGDVLFLPSLRVPRLRDQWGGAPLVRPDARTEEAQRHAALNEAVVLLEPLARQGVQIVFEAPKPVFRAPPFRCSDWFNRGNPVCDGGTDVPRDQLLALNAPAQAAIAAVGKALPGRVTTWDPFPLLCPPGPRCSPFKGNRPLFFDGDHLSGLGNQFLLDDFTRFMQPRLQ